MEEEKKVETLKQTIGLTQLIETIDIQEQKDMLKIQFNLAEEWFSDDELERLNGDGMVVELTEGAQKLLEKWAIENIRKEFKEEFKEEIQEETEIKIAKKFLEYGFKVDDVLKCTDLKRDQVVALSNSIILK